MQRKDYFVIVLILGALSTISPFSIDMYLPGFPAIARELNTSMAQVQLSLTAYLIGIAVGQMLYGPLLDRFGRKPPLYAGLLVYVLASVGCTFSTSIESLIAMRFLQALGGCAGMVAAQTLVRDLFPINQTAQAFSSITLVIAVSPMIAPTVGGYVTVALGWASVFWLLALITVIIIGCVFLVLPEGKKADPGLSLRPKAVLKNFYGVTREPQFILYTLAGGIAMSAPFAYIAASADVFINVYGASEQEYGWIFAIIASGIIGSAQLNHLLLKRFSNQQLVKYTMLFQTVVGSLLIAGVYFDAFSKWGLVAGTFIFLAGQGITGPNCTALALAPFTRHTGSAASLLGSFRMAIGGAMSVVVSAWHDASALPMVTTMVLCVMVGLSVLAAKKVTVRYRARKKAVEDEGSVLV
jgi:DHA1 family bicyclomycin/chloramphenicol resistance-like MFS transporter